MLQWLLLIIAIYIGYRYILAPPSPSSSTQPRGQQRINNINVDPQQIAMLTQMFPQSSEDHLRMQLSRVGNLERLIDAILSGKIQIPARPIVASSSSSSFTAASSSAAAVAVGSGTSSSVASSPVSADMIKNGWLTSAEDREKNFLLKRDFIFQESRRRYLEKHPQLKQT